jgi:hypothetical protein
MLPVNDLYCDRCSAVHVSGLFAHHQELILNCIAAYFGCLTVFAIATGSQTLLNPYEYLTTHKSDTTHILIHTVICETRKVLTRLQNTRHHRERNYTPTDSQYYHPAGTHIRHTRIAPTPPNTNHTGL